MTDLDTARRAVAAYDGREPDSRNGWALQDEAMRACIAYVRSLAPGGKAVAWQFKAIDGVWCLCADEAHMRRTADALYEVRALYLHPAPPTNPEGNV